MEEEQLPKIEKKWMRSQIPQEYFDEFVGVTDTSNWLIPKR